MGLDRNQSSSAALTVAGAPFISSLLIGLLCLLFFLVPLFPDIRLIRPKLLLLESGLFSIAFVWLAAQFFSGLISLRRSLLSLPLICYGIAEAVFYFLSPDRPIAASEMLRTLLSLSAYLLIANIILSEKERNTVFLAALSGSFLASVYGILQHFGGLGRLEVPLMDRAMSTFGNPIFFAAHLVIVIPVALGLLFSLRRNNERFLLLLLIISAVAALYYTQTRAAYLGFVVSLVVFLLLIIESRKVKFFLFSLIVVLFIFFVFFTRHIWLRQQAHFLIWRDTLVMWAHHPWIGTGSGTFHIYFPQFASERLKSIWPQEQFIVNDAHNEFLQYLSETGIIGFGIFAWLIITFFVHARKVFAGISGYDRFLVAGLIASASGILVQNIFSVDMRFIISAVYLFLLMGFIDTFNNDSWKLKISPLPLRVAGIVAVAAAAGFTYPVIFAPYFAQRKVSSTPDFFEARLLEPAKTISDLEELATRYPDQAVIHEKLGWVYSKEKNWPKAIENFERAVDLNPKLAGPLNNLGNIYYLMGNRPMAIGYWNRSLAINPQQIDSRLNLAIAYYYQGELRESAEQLKVILKTDPKNEKAIVLLRQMTE